MPVKKISHTYYVPTRDATSFRTQYDRLLLKSIALNPRKPTGSDKALSHFANVIMAGSFNNTNISYPMVLKSKVVAPAENARASLINKVSILFTWTDNSGVGNAHRTDKVILTAWFPALRKMVYTILPATRGAGKARVEMTAMGGFVAETWIGFVTHDEREAADSVYAGRIIL